MKAHLQSSLRTLTGHNALELSDKDVENFQKVVKGITFEAGTFEMAVAFVAIAVYDKADFIVKRNTRETDLPLIAEAFVHAYRHDGDESMSGLIRRRLNHTGLLANAVIFSPEFEDIIQYLTKPEAMRIH
jgi:hypothetical protein